MIPRYWPLIVPFEDAVTCEDPDDQIQEMTRIIFAAAEEPPDPGLNESSYIELVERMKQKIVDYIKNDAEQITNNLIDLEIYSSYEYESALSQGKIKISKDPWGTPYKLTVSFSDVVTVTTESEGPDKKANTVDDIIYIKTYRIPVISWPVWSGPIFIGGGGGGFYGAGGSFYGGSAFNFSGGGFALSSGGGSLYTSPTIASSPDYAIGEGYLAPTSIPSDGSIAPVTIQETQEPRKIRKDFPETMLWEPSLITDPNGNAYMDTNMADSITTWRMSTVASTLDGKLGGRTDRIVVFQDFFIDIDLPVALTRGDEISLPVAIYNYLEVPQTVKVAIKTDQDNPWFDLMDIKEKTVNLEPGEVTAVYFRIRAGLVGWHEFTVFGYGTQMSDAISRRIEVLPDGMEFNTSVSDFLSDKNIDHVLHIPADAIDDASKILVKFYPGIFSQVVEGLDKLIKVPYG